MFCVVLILSFYSKLFGLYPFAGAVLLVGLWILLATVVVPSGRGWVAGELQGCFWAPDLHLQGMVLMPNIHLSINFVLIIEMG